MKRVRPRGVQTSTVNEVGGGEHVADTLLEETLYEEQLLPVCSPALLAARGRPAARPT